MSDLINRKQALDDARSWVGMNWYEQHLMRDVVEWLEEFPSPWIPVTDGLPERDELVLVTYKTTDKIHLCKYLGDGSENQWWSYIDDCCAWNNVVLAWMPLPEPYKGVIV